MFHFEPPSLCGNFEVQCHLSKFTVTWFKVFLFSATSAVGLLKSESEIRKTQLYGAVWEEAGGNDTVPTSVCRYTEC